MAFGNPKMILLLRRNGLVAYTETDQQAKLELPDSVVRYLELVDQTKFKQLVADFSDRYGLRGRKLAIVLDDSMIFQKIVPQAPNLNANQLQTDFLDQLPFEAGQARAISLGAKNQLILLGANSTVYLALVQALLRKGVKALGVVPLAVYAKGEARLVPDVVSRIYRNHRLFEMSNFLNLEHTKK